MWAYRDRFLRSLAIVAIALTASACGLVEPDSEEEAWREALETARARWEQANLRAYAFTFRQACECLHTGPVRITVVEGETNAVATVADDTPVPEDRWPALSTIEELFALIERGIDEPVDELDVDYHWLLGHPTHISLDWVENMVDDELTVEIDDLEAVEP